jgi:hypothetical protein
MAFGIRGFRGAGVRCGCSITAGAKSNKVGIAGSLPENR